MDDIVYLGNAFDLVGERSRTNFSKHPVVINCLKASRSKFAIARRDSNGASRRASLPLDELEVVGAQP